MDFDFLFMSSILNRVGMTFLSVKKIIFRLKINVFSSVWKINSKSAVGKS